MTRRLLSRFRATGLTTPVGTQSEVMYGAGSDRRAVAADRAARRRRRRCMPVEVEGLKESRYILADEEPILEATADASAQPTPAVSLPRTARSADLGPPLLRSLFGFDYLWEVYVPEAKRR